MLRIRVKKCFTYKPEYEDKFCCKLYVYLPCEGGSGLILNKILRSEKELLTENLGEFWGRCDDTTFNNEKWRRKYTYCYSNESWDDLAQKVEEKIKEIITKVKEVINENIKTLKDKPEDEIKEVLLNGSPV